jgi:hypothetical protein
VEQEETGTKCASEPQPSKIAMLSQIEHDADPFELELYELAAAHEHCSSTAPSGTSAGRQDP